MVHCAIKTFCHVTKLWLETTQAQYVVPMLLVWFLNEHHTYGHGSIFSNQTSTVISSKTPFWLHYLCSFLLVKNHPKHSCFDVWRVFPKAQPELRYYRYFTFFCSEEKLKIVSENYDDKPGRSFWSGSRWGSWPPPPPRSSRNACPGSRTTLESARRAQQWGDKVLESEFEDTKRYVAVAF